MEAQGDRRDEEARWPQHVFEVLGPRGRPRPIIGHIPHSATLIPDPVRAALLLDDAELALEVVRLTDWHTDDLFGFLAGQGATLLVYRLSRLVLDPERYDVDADESMARVGQGVVYLRDTQGRPLREADPLTRARWLAELYVPYHAELDRLSASQLEAFGTCTVLDCHSFASRPLPSEPDPSLDRPDICLGTDATHTPIELVDDLAQAFRREGFSVRLDAPFGGTIIPRAHRGDPRLRSVMVEVRRGLYCDEATGQRTPAYSDVRGAIARAVAVGLGLAGPTD
ncbi:N-formylglutamate amidohydrolase [soil metagenome]